MRKKAIAGRLQILSPEAEVSQRWHLRRHPPGASRCEHPDRAMHPGRWSRRPHDSRPIPAHPLPERPGPSALTGVWSCSLTRAADTEETGTFSSRVRKPSRTASSVQPESAINPVSRMATRAAAHNDGEETDTMQLDKPGVCWCSSTFDNVRNRPIGLRRRRIARNLHGE